MNTITYHVISFDPGRHSLWFLILLGEWVRGAKQITGYKSRKLWKLSLQFSSYLEA